jgi:molybdate transport system substrate-binding protein
MSWKALLVLGALGFAAPARGELLVSAAASLSDALPEVGKAWAAAGGEPILFNFAASSSLVSQIAAGAPVDLVFTADAETLARLEAEGWLDRGAGASRVLLANRLAVVVPEGCPLRIAKAADLASPEIARLAIADPTAVPAGKYARAWLEAQGVWAAVEARVIPTLNVRAALAAVAAGEADAGVVYATDLAAGAGAGGVELAFVVEAAAGPAIAYPAAVVRSSKRLAEARRLLAFLASPEARAIFARFGFGAPTP